MIRSFPILFIGLCVFVSACEQERDPCLEPTTVSMRVGARQILNDTTITDSLLPHPLWIAIDAAKALQFGRNSSSFQIILSPLYDSCRYALQPDSAIASFDTLTFYYTRKLQFLSNACGYTYFYNIHDLHTTRHNIDSAAINNAEVTSNANTPEHVQIFF